MPKIALRYKKMKIRIKKKKSKNDKSKLAFNYFIKDFVDEINNEQ